MQRIKVVLESLYKPRLLAQVAHLAMSISYDMINYVSSLNNPIVHWGKG